MEGRGLSDGEGLDIILLVVKLKRKAPKIGGLFILSGSPTWYHEAFCMTSSLAAFLACSGGASERRLTV